jgi:alpha-glucoside transport system substrate-binding protein
MKLRSRLAAVAALSMVLAGCSVTVNEGSSGGDGGGGDDGASSSSEDGGGGGGEVSADQEENTGSISMSGAASGIEADAIQQVIDENVNNDAEFTATYSGSDSFEQEIIIQIQGGTPPDLALFPQPGAVVEQAQQGNAIALEDLGFDIEELNDRYGEYLMSLGEYEGKHYAVPDTINFKSAVWDNVKEFESQGYETPETWEELITLSDQMVEDGYAPFCLGTGSDAATGWPATDWMEDIVLREQGTDVYDQWVNHEINFASPEIKSAAERFGEIVFTDGYVLGGPSNISATDFRDAPDPMFQDPPRCLMHRQATFITNFFPEGVEAETDYNFFKFPTIDGNDGSLMAGGVIAVLNNRPEILDFLERYTEAEVQCEFGSIGGIALISANKNTEASCYDNPIIQQAADALLTALNDGTARFDGSDLMPPAVGSGSFWTGMNDYTDNGPDNLDSVLESIDAAWPSN